MLPRLLVLTPRFPYPLYGGDVLRVYQLCNALRDSFDITLLSICQSHAELEAVLPENNPFAEVHRVYLPKWRSYTNALSALLMGRSMQVAYYASKDFERAVARLRDAHNIILCHLVRTAPYAGKFNGTKILELTDYIPLTYARSNALKGKSLSLRRWIYTMEKSRVERDQNQLATQFDLITFVSDVDREMFLKSSRISADKVATFGNGVNLHERPFQELRSGKTVAFIGTLTAMPNADAVAYFITSVMPIIHRSEPAMKFRVIGSVDDKFKARHQGAHVSFTGPVPDLPQAVQDCVLGVCPVRIGAGVQNKMLDYMALGLPAITTRIGAEGLSMHESPPFMVADDPQAIADSILLLLNQDERRFALAREARQMIERQFSWAGRLADLPARILHCR